ncbi:MAG: hypothetical protein D6812_05135 [Deltaproteobacteria bacterium]|nr:MAG: hypothetical protein D6812_05135 [Deltaproteobacteria bacterium]
MHEGKESSQWKETLHRGGGIPCDRNEMPFLGQRESMQALEPIELKRLLQQVSDALETAHLAAPALEVHDLLRRLDRNFTVIVLGCFNSGKSSLINALLKQEVCATDRLPKTATLVFFTYGEQEERQVIFAGGKRATFDVTRPLAEWNAFIEASAERIAWVEHTLPHPLLQRLTLVDSPGLNSVFPLHGEVATAAFKSADLIVWVFDPLYTATRKDREYLEWIAEYRTKTLGVLNKIDQIDDTEWEALLDFVREQFGEAFVSLHPLSSLPPYDEETDRRWGRRAFRSHLMAMIEALGEHDRLEARRATTRRVIETIGEKVAREKEEIEEKVRLIEECLADLDRRRRALTERIAQRSEELLSAWLERLTDALTRFLRTTLTWRGILAGEAHLRAEILRVVTRESPPSALLLPYRRALLEGLRSDAPAFTGKIAIDALSQRIEAIVRDDFLSPLCDEVATFLTRGFTILVFGSVMGVQEALILTIGGAHRIPLLLYTLPLWVIFVVLFVEAMRGRRRICEVARETGRLEGAIARVLHDFSTSMISQAFAGEEAALIRRLFGISVGREEILTLRQKTSVALRTVEEVLRNLDRRE